MTASMHEEPQRSTTALYEAAVAYAALGWHVIPLKPRSKVAAIEWRNGRVNYQETAPTADELYMWFVEWTVEKRVNGIWTSVRFTEQPNIAGILRDDKVQLDFDGLDADGGGFGGRVRDFPLLVDLPRVRTGSGKVHIFFGVRSPIQHHDIPLPGGGVIEVRTGRNIAVLPPSIHPNGEPYVWEIVVPETGLPIIDPATVGVKARPKLTVVGHEYHEGDPLSEGEIDVITEAVASHWKEDTNRHKLALGVSGWLASIGAPEEDARTVVSRLGDTERMAEYQRCVRDTYVKRVNHESTLGWSELERRLDAEQLRSLNQITDDHTPTFTMPPPLDPTGNPAPWIQTYSEFMAMEFPKPWWLVDSLIPGRDFGMVYGPGGAKKSWWLLLMGICIAAGRDFLNYYVPDPQPVLYVQEEIGSYYLQERLHAIERFLGVDPALISKNFRTISNKQFRLDKGDSVDRMVDEDVAVRGTKLIMFDPFAHLHNSDENSAQEMMPIFQKLLGIREAYDLAMLIAHHPNKGDVLRGSSIMQAASDLIIRIMPDEGDETKSLVTFEKTRNLRHRPEPHIFQLLPVGEIDVDFRLIEVEGAKAKPNKGRGYTTDDILTLVDEGGQFTLETLAKKLNLTIPPTKKYPEALRRTVIAMIDARSLKQTLGNPLTFEMPDI